VSSFTVYDYSSGATKKYAVGYSTSGGCSV